MKQAFFFLGLLFILRSPALAEPGRLERVIAAGEVRVCIWPDYYGISFRNPKTRELKGSSRFTGERSLDLQKEIG